MQLGEWQLETINGGRFRLDGGVMFGVVPKTLWEKQAACDELNRVPVAGHCVLARNGRHTVLLDTGYGGKFGQLDRKFYSLEGGEPLLVSLAAHGVRPEEIDLVVFSHLHFDHAGGATRWDDGRAALVFPRARFVAGRIEWEDALSDSPVFEGAYPKHNLLPLAESGRVELFESGDEILPGLKARVTGGHTRGHATLEFASGGQTAIFFGDVCPSRRHMRRLWNLAYDLYPLDTRRTKMEMLGDAADRGAWVLWSHDPDAAASRIARDPKREFVVVESIPSL